MADQQVDPDIGAFPRFNVTVNDLDISPSCNYTDINELVPVLPPDFCSLLLLNIRSCRKNFLNFITDFDALVHEYSIIVLVETWLDSVSDQMFSLNGFQQENLYRDGNGGGIKVYLRNNIQFNVINDFTFVRNGLEILTLNLTIGGINFLLCCIYHPPKSDHDYNLQFVNMLTELLRRCLAANSRLVLCGDMNLNILNPLQLGYIYDYINSLLECSLLPLVTIPTKFNPSNQITRYAILDQVWVTSQFLDAQVLVIKNSITDHFPVSVTFPLGNDEAVEGFKFRVINPDTILSFKEMVSGNYFNAVFNSNDPVTAYDCFNSLLNKAYNLHVPVKSSFNKRNCKTPWMTYKLKRCINKKHKFYRLYCRGIIERHSYTNYRNILTSVIRRIKKLYYLKMFYSSVGNTRETWRCLSRLLKRDAHVVPDKVVVENFALTGIGMVNGFNQYFVSIADKLTADIVMDNHAVPDNQIPTINDTCFLMPVTVKEVTDTLKSLPNKSGSIDDLHMTIFRECIDVLAPALAFIFNLSTEKGIFPDKLKIARVTPVYKADDRKVLGNYRPISNLSNISKLFEKLTFSRINSFVETKRIISSKQFGFRKRKNISMVIFHMMSRLTMVYHQRKYAVCLFLDLQKAFDCVDRSILKRKLYRYGFRGVCGDFLESYLTDRMQYVQISSHKSDILRVCKGVPQGSTLGPLLFNLFINDITCIDAADIFLFADDAAFLVIDETFENVYHKLSKLVADLSHYLKVNRLVPNLKKTKLMLFTACIYNVLPPVLFDGVALEWVSNVKYLGITLASNLNFNLHVNEVTMKISKLHGMFAAISHHLPTSVLVILYFSLVYPHLIQNIIIWGGAPESVLAKLRVKINNVLRCILKVQYVDGRPLMSVNGMYRLLEFLKVEDIYKYYLLKFIHGSLYGNMSDIYECYFAPLVPRHTYASRETRLRLPPVRLEVEKRATLFQSVKLYNELPHELLQPQSLKSLVQRFKLHVFAGY